MHVELPFGLTRLLNVRVTARLDYPLSLVRGNAHGVISRRYHLESPRGSQPARIRRIVRDLCKMLAVLDLLVVVVHESVLLSFPSEFFPWGLLPAK